MRRQSSAPAFKAPGDFGPQDHGKYAPVGAAKGIDPCVLAAQQMEDKRQKRRERIKQAQHEKEKEKLEWERNGLVGDVDFQLMIKQYRAQPFVVIQPHTHSATMKISVCVRKRPINQREVLNKEYDAVTAFNPRATVHSSKFKVDGISKHLSNEEFEFDHVFHESDSNDLVYQYTAQPLIPFVLSGGKATVFAYGQTGSGKTYTMSGVQRLATRDLFEMMYSPTYAALRLSIWVSFYEIYGGRCQDLLNERKMIIIRDDGKGNACLAGLNEIQVTSYDELMVVMKQGNASRTTHATEVNEMSSRSHAIFQIVLRLPNNKEHGKLSLIDLAGSERAQDSRSHNRQRRVECAEINKSLLALKECIRYADRVKEKKVGGCSGYVDPEDGMCLPVSLEVEAPLSRVITTPRRDFKHLEGQLSPVASKLRRIEMDRKAGIITDEEKGRLKDQVLSKELMKSRLSPDRSSSVRPESAFFGDDEVDEKKMKDAEDEDSDMLRAEAADLQYLHKTLRRSESEPKSSKLLDFHEAVSELVAMEERVLSMHMQSVQDNVAILTEEGRILTEVQRTPDYDMDFYASKLEALLDQKIRMTTQLKQQLTAFRKALAREETTSRQVDFIPEY